MSTLFLIERSADGQQFEPIGQLPAAGNSQQQRNYTFSDEHPGEGKNYYRLKMMDMDNRFKYSDIQVVSFRKEKSAVLTVYPNPVTDKISLNMAPAGNQLWLQVVNYQGQKVWGSQGSISALNIALNGQLKQLAPGIYFIHLQDGSTRHIARFYKQ
ncbi:MAG: T9SS type A sorting domain-containing protein [Pedobacter sp.]|nr:MAG: T9SS type A sorting domain-containing protein [Pedobacter sp.]